MCHLGTCVSSGAHYAGNWLHGLFRRCKLCDGHGAADSRAQPLHRCGLAPTVARWVVLVAKFLVLCLWTGRLLPVQFIPRWCGRHEYGRKGFFFLLVWYEWCGNLLWRTDPQGLPMEGSSAGRVRCCQRLLQRIAGDDLRCCGYAEALGRTGVVSFAMASSSVIGHVQHEGQGSFVLKCCVRVIGHEQNGQTSLLEEKNPDVVEYGSILFRFSSPREGKFVVARADAFSCRRFQGTRVPQFVRLRCRALDSVWRMARCTL